MAKDKIHIKSTQSEEREQHKIIAEEKYNNLKKRLKECEFKLSEQTRLCAKKDGKLHKKGITIKNKNIQIESLKSQLAHSRHNVDSLKKELAEKNKRLEAAENELAQFKDADSALRFVKRRVEKLKETKKSAEKIISEIKSIRENY